jgi:hypothetical protein
VTPSSSPTHVVDPADSSKTKHTCNGARTTSFIIEWEVICIVNSIQMAPHPERELATGNKPLDLWNFPYIIYKDTKSIKLPTFY